MPKHYYDGLEVVAIIKFISNLRNKARSLSRLCHDSGEPIYITKNGEGDMVFLSLAVYERLEAQLDLYQLLNEADVRAGDRGIGMSLWEKHWALPISLFHEAEALAGGRLKSWVLAAALNH